MKLFSVGIGIAAFMTLGQLACGPGEAGDVNHPTAESGTSAQDVKVTHEKETLSFYKKVHGINPTAKSAADEASNQARIARNRGNGISYHGGPVMTGAKNVYYIWYGNWSGNSANTILTNLAQNIGGSPYFNINTTYHNGSNVAVANTVSYSGSTTDNYSHGTALSDAQIEAVVSSAITSGRLPNDVNGFYAVLTSADVNATSGFCTQYCGWHWHFSQGANDIKYAFIGNPDRCPSACEAQTTSPNGNPGADGMASIISHELEEAATDPDGNAWYDSRGFENADKCAWTFGTESTASNGSHYNVTLGGTHYLIQQNWLDASGGSCTMHYP